MQGTPVRKDNLLKIREAMANLSDGAEIRLKALRAGEIVELEKNYYPDLFVPPAPQP